MQNFKKFKRHKKKIKMKSLDFYNNNDYGILLKNIDPLIINEKDYFIYNENFQPIWSK
jgi:hypothetical protein